MEAPNELRKPREWVRTEINLRIDSGRDLLEAVASCADLAEWQDCQDNFVTWHEYNRDLLRECYAAPGTFHEYVTETSVPVYWAKPSLNKRIDDLRSRIREKIRRLESICDRLEFFEYRVPESGNVQEGDSFEDLDPELWEHVRALIVEEQWPQAASAAATFVESRIREWCEFGPDKYGRELISAAMNPKYGAPLTLGYTDGEKEGWHLLGMGFMGALGNVDRHRVQERDDLRRYGLGVLYAASLLLTQFRHQYPDRT